MVSDTANLVTYSGKDDDKAGDTLEKYILCVAVVAVGLGNAPRPVDVAPPFKFSKNRGDRKVQARAVKKRMWT